jgi:hypothetical protein
MQSLQLCHAATTTKCSAIHNDEQSAHSIANFCQFPIPRRSFRQPVNQTVPNHNSRL